MLQRPVLASLTRISDLNEMPYDVKAIAQNDWNTGDYVVAEVISRHNAKTPVELASGRMTELVAGDHLIGALGIRAATLEAAGHWNAVGPDLQMQALTGAGLLGRATSVSPFISSLLQLQYVGHVARQETKVRMSDFVRPGEGTVYDRPTILMIGTSMSSGKTTSAGVLIRCLARMGLKIAGVKFTGAGRYKDTLAMRDAGADCIFDFVDVGLPSTVCPADTYRDALSILLEMIQLEKPDVVIAEAGASPLEPYNGDTLIDELGSQICCTVLCASDPYAVLGVTRGFGFEPDFVTGVATSTTAGVELIRNLTGSLALNLLDPESNEQLQQLLIGKLGLKS